MRFDANDQSTPDFVSLSPNNKAPAILDPQGPGGKPLPLFESGALLFPRVNNLIGFYGAGDLVGIADFAEVTRVLKAFLERPAVQRGLRIAARPKAAQEPPDRRYGGTARRLPSKLCANRPTEKNSMAARTRASVDDPTKIRTATNRRRPRER